MTGLGRRHLDRTFKEATGMTPKQFMERACVQRSALRLCEYGQSVKFVAYTSRFHSPSHFVTWFRRQTGLTPREFAVRYR